MEVCYWGILVIIGLIFGTNLLPTFLDNFNVISLIIIGELWLIIEMWGLSLIYNSIKK